MAKKKSKKNTYIFTKLVDDKNDIRGHIAYAIYKFEKVSHIEQFIKENHREPTAEEKEGFRASCCNPSRLEEYKERANIILNTFSNEVLRGAVNQIESDYIKDMDSHLDSVVRSAQHTLSKQYLHGILQSMIGTFLMAFVVWGIVTVVSKYDEEDLFPPQGSELNTKQTVPLPSDTTNNVKVAPFKK